MTTTACPGCGADVPTAVAEAIEDGNILVCNVCGYRGVWDHDGANGWRVLSREENLALISSEGYLRDMEFRMLAKAHHDRDRGRLVQLISMAIYAGHHCDTFPAEVPPIVERLADLLIKDGFHTHPTGDVASAMEGLI